MRPSEVMPSKRLLAVMIERVGFRKATKIGGFIAAWMIAERRRAAKGETGVMLVDEYSDWWRQSRAQGFREQALFRTCFPEFATPRELWAAIPDAPPLPDGEAAAIAEVLAAPAPVFA